MTQIVIILQIDLFEIVGETNLNKQDNLNKKEKSALKQTFKIKIWDK